MKYEFSTTHYERAHGKKPRGTGRWAFMVDSDIVFAPGAMTLVEAKKWLVDDLKGKGIAPTRIYIEG